MGVPDGQQGWREDEMQGWVPSSMDPFHENRQIHTRSILRPVYLAILMPIMVGIGVDERVLDGHIRAGERGGGPIPRCFGPGNETCNHSGTMLELCWSRPRTGNFLLV